VGEDVRASVTNHSNVFIASTTYEELVAQHIAAGYRETKRPKKKRKSRPQERPTPLQPERADRLLGKLTKHPITKSWEGHIDISGTPVPISFDDMDTELDAARAMARLIKRRIKSITKKAAKDVTQFVYDCVDP